MLVFDTDFEDVEDFELEQEPQIEICVEEVVEGILSLAKDSIKKFFNEREMYCGGKVPDRLLLTEKNISLVANTTLESGVALAYEAIEKSGNYNSEASDSLVPEDVKLVISNIKACAKLRIPQRYIPGIMLLNLKFCEGLQVGI